MGNLEDGAVAEAAGFLKGQMFNPKGLLGSRLRGLPKMHESLHTMFYYSNNVVPAKAGIQEG
jgi:hypothetical protein